MDELDRRIYEAYLNNVVNKKSSNEINEKVKYASIYGAGVAIGIGDDGIYTLEMSLSRNYFSMSSNVLAPVTEEMLEEWERDTIEYEAPYYYSEVFGRGDEEDWEELSPSEQEEEIDSMVRDMVQSKLDGMSGDFDWNFKGKEDNYHLDMVSAGQDQFESLKYPIINKRDYDVLNKAWKTLHLKDLKEIMASPDDKALMNKAHKIYKSLEKKQQQLLEKSIQFYMLKLRGTKDKLLQKIVQKKGYKLGKLR